MKEVLPALFQGVATTRRGAAGLLRNLGDKTPREPPVPFHRSREIQRIIQAHINTVPTPLPPINVRAAPNIHLYLGWIFVPFLGCILLDLFWNRNAWNKSNNIVRCRATLIPEWL